MQPSKRQLIEKAIRDNPGLSGRQIAAKLGVSKTHVNDIRKSQKDYGTAVIFGDVHVPYHDQAALDIALDHAVSLDPDYFIVNGDFADFYQISRWKNDPHRMPYDEERAIAKEMLADLGKLFCDSRKIFIVGNHELRLERLCWSGTAKQLGSRLSLESELGIAEAGFEQHDNIKLLSDGLPPFSIGSLHIMHGHEVRVAITAVRPAKLYYEKTRVNVIASHCHRTSEFPAKKYNKEYDWAYTTGCLCRLSEPYAPVNDWVHGFAVVKLYPDGTFDVRNHKIMNGRVI